MQDDLDSGEKQSSANVDSENKNAEINTEVT